MNVRCRTLNLFLWEKENYHFYNIIWMNELMNESWIIEKYKYLLTYVRIPTSIIICKTNLFVVGTTHSLNNVPDVYLFTTEFICKYRNWNSKCGCLLLTIINIIETKRGNIWSNVAILRVESSVNSFQIVCYPKLFNTWFKYGGD